MTMIATIRSAQRIIVITCVILVLLTLPFVGALHCQVMHDDHEHASTPLAEACCVFLCFTALIGMTVVPVLWLTIARAAPHLKPVRLSNHLARWVPPPRPIGSLV